MGDNKSKSKRGQRKFFPTRIYDYNYKVSESYYKPQTDFMDYGSDARTRYEPPKHQSYAERFASNPWYGSTHGLPYRSDYSALNEPLLKPSENPVRSSSLLKEIRALEEQDIPLNIRANRRRRRFEEEDEKLGIRPRQLSLGREEKPRLPPRYRDVADKLRSLDAELIRLAPRRSSVTENTYTGPSGSSYQSSYKSEASHYNSSSARPPISPRVRKTSYNEDFADLPPRPRGRVSSFTEQTTSRSRRSSITEQDDFGPGLYSSRAGKLRDERRLRESREMTDNVHKMVEKMRATKLNPEDGYKLPKSAPSTLDSRLKDERKIPASFVYGVNRAL
jgi:hypothetical protein